MFNIYFSVKVFRVLQTREIAIFVEKKNVRKVRINKTSEIGRNWEILYVSKVKDRLVCLRYNPHQKECIVVSIRS